MNGLFGASTAGAGAAGTAGTAATTGAATGAAGTSAMGNFGSGFSSGLGQSLGTPAAQSTAGQAAAAASQGSTAGQIGSTVGHLAGQQMGGVAPGGFDSNGVPVQGASNDILKNLMFNSGGGSAPPQQASNPKLTEGKPDNAGGWFGMGVGGNDKYNPNPSTYAPAHGTQQAQEASNVPIIQQPPSGEQAAWDWLWQRALQSSNVA